ncbi:MAG TPA: hypothetical protein VFV92_03725 [Candidatus Bathyarchaeia archaeon]|nr:hypothetical protein [Candidatus Bathyarchaeia archaeon]
MSNIPVARLILEHALTNIEMSEEVADAINEALSHMTRESPIRRAPDRQQPITPEIKQLVIALAEDEELTMVEIAQLSGLDNQGRVSEILCGKR